MTQEQTLTTVEIVLVDDHGIWRDGVKSLLEDTEFQVIGEAASGKEAMALLQTVRPRLLLLDIRMAGGDGLDTLQAIKAQHPEISVVMLTTYDNPTYMARAVAGGASGYLLKGVGAEELLTSLRVVASGDALISPKDLSRSLRSVNPEGAGDADLIKPLSTRELEVLRLLATGLNNRDIAGLLFVSEGTVKTHVEHIIGKLGVSDRVQAVVWAARHGVISLETG
ncbi:DNA-binding response regulator [Capsulimonas corticalis]|uniref:DNA-binding response regulator n=1 Tax=Capsulimonas corticalis TaxID=2219043 RepID=A0A402D1K2_9BACT|nr:response regulator transcription factor [Capsulimonas corticalis]BDI28619.1 DNA-binding response regulator [Capsulimonas corticalis]